MLTFFACKRGFLSKASDSRGNVRGLHHKNPRVYFQHTPISNIVYFHPNFGEMIQYESLLVQMGWFNHQLVSLFQKVAETSISTSLRSMASRNPWIFKSSVGPEAAPLELQLLGNQQLWMKSVLPIS